MSSKATEQEDRWVVVVSMEWTQTIGIEREETMAIYVRMEVSWRTYVCTQVSCLKAGALSGGDWEAFVHQWNLLISELVVTWPSYLKVIHH